jgi:formylglycine-generating enzyme required for sulfatase activity
VQTAKGLVGALFKGGCWDRDWAHCVAGSRFFGPLMFRNNHLGLRVARVPAGKQLIAPLSPPPDKKTESTKTFTNSLGMEFVLVPRGKGWLGGGDGKPGDNEQEIKADFYLGKYEVTQGEWERVVGGNPSHFSRSGEGKDAVKNVSDADLQRFPVEMVSADDVDRFLAEPNKRDGHVGWVYRLPNLYEWEYACRGGPIDRADSAFNYYLEKPVMELHSEVANVETKGALQRTCKVGSYAPNRLGLHDMHGNVWEWCAYRMDFKGTPAQPFLGGCWRGELSLCKLTLRIIDWADIRQPTRGLRVALMPVGK